jgi:hypothetical protein
VARVPQGYRHSDFQSIRLDSSARLFFIRSMPPASPIPVPAIRAERCIIYCLTCGRNTSAATYVIEGLFGFLPYGFLTGRLHCRKGCGDRFGVILPLDAPTPRTFVAKYGRPIASPPKSDSRAEAALDDDLRGALVEIGKNGTFWKIHARAEDDAILHWGFDHLLKKMSVNGREPPRLAVTRGAQWSRDSQRDFKVVQKVIPYDEPAARDDQRQGLPAPGKPGDDGRL